jgi:hypothetical protein
MAAMMNVLYENSKKEYPRSVTELLRKKEYKESVISQEKNPK